MKKLLLLLLVLVVFSSCSNKAEVELLSTHDTVSVEVVQEPIVVGDTVLVAMDSQRGPRLVSMNPDSLLVDLLKKNDSILADSGTIFRVGVIRKR